MGKMDGRVAIITGASRGIGAEIARVFAAAGGKVVCAARTLHEGDHQLEGSLEKTVQDIQDDWPEDGPIVAERTLRRVLNQLFVAGEIGRIGTGKKNDPYKYGEI